MKKSLIFLALIFLACSSENSDLTGREQKSENSRILENSNKSEFSKTNASAQIVIKKGDTNASRVNENIFYDMDGQQKIKKFGFGEENATTRTIGAISLQRRPLESVDRALLRGMLSKNFLLKCSACHDDYANGIIGPSLLKMSKEEIFNAIKAFQNKEKANVLMSDLIKRMKDDEIKSLADEIHEFNENIRTRSKK